MAIRGPRASSRSHHLKADPIGKEMNATGFELTPGELDTQQSIDAAIADIEAQYVTSATETAQKNVENTGLHLKLAQFNKKIWTNGARKAAEFLEAAKVKYRNSFAASRRIRNSTTTPEDIKESEKRGRFGMDFVTKEAHPTCTLALGDDQGSVVWKLKLSPPPRILIGDLAMPRMSKTFLDHHLSVASSINELMLQSKALGTDQESAPHIQTCAPPNAGGIPFSPALLFVALLGDTLDKVRSCVNSMCGKGLKTTNAELLLFFVMTIHTGLIGGEPDDGNDLLEMRVAAVLGNTNVLLTTERFNFIRNRIGVYSRPKNELEAVTWANQHYAQNRAGEYEKEIFRVSAAVTQGSCSTLTITKDDSKERSFAESGMPGASHSDRKQAKRGPNLDLDVDALTFIVLAMHVSKTVYSANRTEDQRNFFLETHMALGGMLAKGTKIAVDRGYTSLLFILAGFYAYFSVFGIVVSHQRQGNPFVLASRVAQFEKKPKSGETRPPIPDNAVINDSIGLGPSIYWASGTVLKSERHGRNRNEDMPLHAFAVRDWGAPRDGRSVVHFFMCSGKYNEHADRGEFGSVVVARVKKQKDLYADGIYTLYSTSKGNLSDLQREILEKRKAFEEMMEDR